MLYSILEPEEALRMLTILKKNLEEQETSLFAANTNPVRLGFILYKVVTDCFQLFRCPEFICENLKTVIEDILLELIEGYQDIKEL